MKNMPTLTRQLQEKYCNDAYNKCARYLVNKMFIEGYTPKDDKAALEFEKAFDSLYPNNIDKAGEIINQLVK